MAAAANHLLTAKTQLLEFFFVLCSRCNSATLNYEGCPKCIQLCNIVNRGFYGWTFSGHLSYVRKLFVYLWKNAALSDISLIRYATMLRVIMN